MDLESYRYGYRDGYKAAREDAIDFGQPLDKFQAMSKSIVAMPKKFPYTKESKRRVKQSPKQKLLTKMTKKKWDRYKKGSGKKTYVQIRAEVSRSQAFKKAARRL